MNDRAEFDALIEDIRQLFEAKSAARDAAIAQSRAVISHSANAIRAVHRHEWETARERLETARLAAEEMRRAVEAYPDLYHSGYTQDALKEVAEAYVTYALVRGEALPTPESLAVEPATYLNGLAEAASELRRQILDIIRKGHSDEAQRLLEEMDQIYDALISFDFHDAITGGLRRRLDQLRGVLERTRGDVTNSLRQERLQEALAALETRIGLDAGPPLELPSEEPDDEGG